MSDVTLKPDTTIDDIVESHERREEKLNTEIVRLNTVIDAVRIQAQTWHQEALTQRGTVYRIYEIVSGKTGEPGDWHGEIPVADEIARLNAVIQAMAEALHERYCVGGNTWKKCGKVNPIMGECKQCIIDHFTKQEAKDNES